MADRTHTLLLERATWRPMLAAIPVRNVLAKTETRPDAMLRVRVPLRHPGWLVPPLSWVVRPRHQRVVSLDRIGTEVWQACDGRRTVEQIVDAFSERRRLTFHEARAAVTGFLRSLVQRGILAVEMKDS